VRWLRQVAVAFYQLHGRRPPNGTELDRRIDPASSAAVAAILESVRRGRGLDRFRENALFRKRLDRQLRRLFRS
jgi:hypothetical protein